MYRLIFFFSFLLFSSFAQSQSALRFGLVKYNGGGDWYSNPTSLPNLATFCNRQLNTAIDPEYIAVEVGSAELFNYPFLHLTGHGNVVFSDNEAFNLRQYLLSGGFLHIDDNYGMDPYIRVAMKKVFPELEFVELPFDHPIYHQKFDFNQGPPKVHEHDNQAPRGYALLWEGRVICFYTFESDLGDGWEDQEVHNDPESVRLQALKMGANIIQFAFDQ